MLRTGQSPIFSTAHLAVRALAAELRHAPRAARTAAAVKIARDPGELLTVMCEDPGVDRVDLALQFERLTVGIVARFAHESTAQTLAQEQSLVDHLIVLVPNPQDITESVLANVTDRTGRRPAVMTWFEMLDLLPGSRITLADVDAIDLGKRIIRTVLDPIHRRYRPLTLWDARYETANSGYPSLVFYSAPVDDTGRYYVVHIECPRREIGQAFVINAGISVKAGDFRSVEAGARWAAHARVLGSRLEAALHGSVAEIDGEGVHGNSERTRMKLAQAAQYGVPLHHSVGYLDAFLGVRTVRIAPHALSSALDLVLGTLNSGFGHQRSVTAS